ncbi:MAG: DUF4398 domain-containing protein [Vicinamibacterales bacterium]
MPRALPLARLTSLVAIIVVILLAAACSEPPSKEMNQAQGAIDAARAAGAEQYAPDELKAAIDALAQSEVAVTARDYRLALAHALDSRERAQEAARAAVDARAKARGDAERELAEATALLQRVQARLKDPAVAKLPRRAIAAHQQTVTTVETALQKARASLEVEQYDEVGRAAADATSGLRAVLDALDAGTTPPARQRRR